MDEAVAVGAGAGPWGVAALLLAARDAVAARFGAADVRGEISAYTRAASGHCYFTLKDADGAPALLRCAMFRRAAAMLDFVPAEGQQVRLRGRLSVYEARGELQLVVEAMQRVGAGTLYEQFLRLRDRLAALGLFDSAHKRALPREPRALGVVTSLGAAALHDVLTALARRAPNVRVVVYPCTVQGTEAPPSIVSALAEANRRAEVQALLLVRGGGSLEDLWSFNDERVVRAIAESRLPVVCGVGHETDVTLADLVADLRAPTPTAAAELAAPSRDELLAALAAREQLLQRALQRAAQVQAQRLDRLSLRLGAPARMVGAQQQRLALLRARMAAALRLPVAAQRQALQELSTRLPRAWAVTQADHARRLDARAQRLVSLDPHRVLQRGYAWVEDASGRPIISASALTVGDTVQARWADGRASTLVQAVDVEPSAVCGGDPR
ncbi:MAG: exodeoxyribonuclease VII large subunit [Rubrivivax sp.]|nr:exodeoxyribonuclease VII large subunit [Rubrivivax sp.]